MTDNYLNKLLRIFYVRKCVSCGELLPFTTLDNTQMLCAKCEEEWIEEKTEICNFCKKNQFNCTCGFSKSSVDSVRHLAIYSSDDRDSVCFKVIHSLKKNNNKILFDFATDEMIKHLIPKFDTAKTVIVSVPRNPQTISEIGHDHALLLARSISHKTGIKYIPALKQAKGAKVQKNLNKSEREQNARRFIHFKEKIKNDIAGKTVFLIDDVGTTGATTGVCAELLKLHGAVKVHCILFAKSSKKYVK